MAIEFCVHGKPVSANVSWRHERAGEWKATVRAAARKAMGRQRPSVALGSAIVVFFHTPPKWMDTDNILKHTIDGLSGVVFPDDACLEQVVARQSRLTPGFRLVDPRPPVVRAIAQDWQNFVYIWLGGPPDHERLPQWTSKTS
jgi:hypothetical protein